jgi:epoxyqueuosine reductase
MPIAQARSVLTASEVKRQAATCGFDLCGIAPVGELPELAFFPQWLEAGYAGRMDYLERSAERRSDVRQIMPEARTVVVFGTIYNTDQPYSIDSADRTEAALARYAWGDDYHVAIGARLDQMMAWLREQAGDALRARAYVDTGPVQERVYARHAGLGWIGKNTCVIHPDLGSWIFLSEIICNLELEPDVPALDQCGTCTRCLDACPTGALAAPYVLDARRCLSYLTIELKDAIPVEHRGDIGRHAYGCDICQEVCPYNFTAATTTDAAFAVREGLERPSLLEMWRRSDDDLRRILKGSPMKRAGVRRLRRNLAVALGNSGDAGAAAALNDRHASTCDDPLVEEHVRWALEKLGD